MMKTVVLLWMSIVPYCWALHSSPYEKTLLAERKWGFDVSVSEVGLSSRSY